MARDHANVYLEVACSPVYDGVLGWMVDEVGAEPVLFGTDVAFLDPRPQFGRRRAGRHAGAAKRHVLGGNLRRILAS